MRPGSAFTALFSRPLIAQKSACVTATIYTPCRAFTTTKRLRSEPLRQTDEEVPKGDTKSREKVTGNGKTVDFTSPERDRMRRYDDLSRALSGMYSSAENQTVEKIPKTGPTAGRSLEVQHGDVARTMRRLDGILRINNVRNQFRTQRFHEKPSRKRKRLKREQHRKRFKKGIVHLVTLVQEMRAKGL
jgi:ribosomal protein S21